MDVVGSGSGTTGGGVAGAISVVVRSSWHEGRKVWIIAWLVGVCSKEKTGLLGGGRGGGGEGGNLEVEGRGWDLNGEFAREGERGGWVGMEK